MDVNIKEELRKNLKNIIILLVLLILYIVMVVFFSSDKNNSQVDGYLIVGDSLIYQKKGDDFEQLTDVPDLSDFVFNVYDGNDKIENIKIQYNSNEWYFFDENYNEKELDNFRIAYTNNFDIKVNDSSIQKYSSSDEEYIKEVTKETNDFSLQSYRNSLDKLVLDYDNDGIDETLYSITNFSYQVTDYRMMSYLFVVDDGDIQILDSAEGLNPFIIIDALDLNGDSKMDVIVANEVMDVPRFDICYQVYGMKGNKFSLIKSCK